MIPHIYDGLLGRRLRLRVEKDLDAELLTAIRAVHNKGTFVTRVWPASCPGRACEKRRQSAPKRQVSILSERELEVLKLVAQGYTSQQIAKRILVGVKTVETYRARLAQKLGLRTRSDVVRFAVQMGLLTPETLEAGEGRSAR